MTKIFVIVTVFLVFLNYASGYRILCPYPANSRSHFIVAEALFKGLAAKGHDVTVISAFPPEQPIPNYRHVTLKLVSDHDEMMKLFTSKPGEMGLTLDFMLNLAQITLNESRAMLKNPEVEKIMAEESFDLVIMEFLGEPHIGLAAHFNCPVIIFASVKSNYHLLDLIGNPLAISYVKNQMFPWTDLTQFKDRLINMGLYIMETLMMKYFSYLYSDFHDKHFPAPKYPSFQEVFDNNIAAVFVTQHFSQGDVRPLVPNLIEISGIQMTEKASPLPDALQAWMDQSANGVIFFSFGSNLKVSDISPDRLEAIINVFKTLKQNVLWKSDVTKIAGLSKNVRLEKWVSQVDVLQHNNTKGFITHGGFGSITEAKFYGVPVLVIPMFADQIPNADSVVSEGWGVKLSYANFTEQPFMNSLNEIIENPKYVANAKYESMLYRDRPLTPLQTGIFWVEYILRHKGAHHMRTNAKHLNWFQLHSVDVIGFLSAILFIVGYILYIILKFLVKKLFGAKKLKLKRN